MNVAVATGHRLLTRCEIQIFRSKVTPPPTLPSFKDGFLKDVILERQRGSFGLLTLRSPINKTVLYDEADGVSTGVDYSQRLTGGGSNIEDVEIRQYDGRIRGGPFAGERVTIKMYPNTKECDLLAANELRIHEELQPPKTEEECSRLKYLIGGYTTNEAQCLVFRRSDSMSLAQYTQLASEALQKGLVVGSGDLWDILDPKRAIKRRKKVFIQIFRGIAVGLHFMHKNFKLHQSLGPESVLISDLDESDCLRLKVQLGDLALGVDMSDLALDQRQTIGEIWDYANEQAMQKDSILSSSELWTRARMSGAWTESDKRNFGIADDIGSLGFLYLYTILTAFSPKGSVDCASVFRLVQTTFDSDIIQFGEYCREDENLMRGVEFLDMEDGAGWELINAMINKDWKSRPTADSCLNHRFLNGTLMFEDEI